jgi:hypothetical protein
LREGGSLPALAEADDDFKYVPSLKEQGMCKSLDCRALGGEIARVLKLAIPELVFANLDEALVVLKPMKKFKTFQGSQGSI